MFTPQIPKVGLVYDPYMGQHKAEDSHWERPERIWSIYQTLLVTGMVPLLTPIRSRAATYEELCLAHEPKYVDRLKKQLTSKNPGDWLTDPDLYANKYTNNSALLAAGSAVDLTKAVLNGHLDSGFAIVRPPGHHATPGACMGFCFYHNLGIAAMMASNAGKRVLIVDWDIHHGNGTEALLKSRPKENVLFFSIQRWDRGKFYPGTGESKETSTMISVGFNGPKGDDFYLKTFKEVLLPKAKAFKPDIILVSCGFDAAIGDPLGQCHVTPDGYYKMTKLLQSICPKIAMILEGGYNLGSISKSALACIQALLGLPLEIPMVIPLEIPKSIGLSYPEMTMES